MPFEFAPEGALVLAPSDQRYILRRLRNIQVDDPSDLREILTALGTNDPSDLLSFPIFYPTLHEQGLLNIENLVRNASPHALEELVQRRRYNDLEQGALEEAVIQALRKGNNTSLQYIIREFHRGVSYEVPEDQLSHVDELVEGLIEFIQDSPNALEGRRLLLQALQEEPELAEQLYSYFQEPSDVPLLVQLFRRNNWEEVVFSNYRSFTPPSIDFYLALREEGVELDPIMLLGRINAVFNFLRRDVRLNRNFPETVARDQENIDATERLVRGLIAQRIFSRGEIQEALDEIREERGVDLWLARTLTS